MNESPDDAVEILLRRQFDGPVPDAGFAERVMQALPPRRRRVRWPAWAGLAAGAVACWLALLPSPLLRVAWRDVLRAHWSAADITLLLVMAGMALLALAWGIAEADEA